MLALGPAAQVRVPLGAGGLGGLGPGGADGARVLLLEPSASGQLVLAVSAQLATVLCCNGRQDWTPVGLCARPALGALVGPEAAAAAGASAQAAWSADCASFVICNALGIAEFYDVFSAGLGGSSGALGKPNAEAVRLSLPRWVGRGETRSGRLLSVVHRCSINSTVEGERVSLFSAVPQRMWLLMGTGRGSLVRVLWTGEIVAEKEVRLAGAAGSAANGEAGDGASADGRADSRADSRAESHADNRADSRADSDGKGSGENGGGGASSAAAAAEDGSAGEQDPAQHVLQVVSGWRERVAFVTRGGRCGVLAAKQRTYDFCAHGATSVALHQSRPLAIVGTAQGDVELHAVGSSGARLLRRVAFPLYALPEPAAADRARRGFGSVLGVQWEPSGSGFFAAGYGHVGVVLWSIGGTRCCTLAQREVGRGSSGSGGGGSSGGSSSNGSSSSNGGSSSTTTTSATGGRVCFAWAQQGYCLLQSAPSSTTEQELALDSFELVRCCSSGPLVSGSTSMAMQGHDHVLSLSNKEWDVKSLSWSRVDVPAALLEVGGPVRLVAASLTGDYVAVCGAVGLAVYSRLSRRWQALEEGGGGGLGVAELACKLLFWWGDDALFAVVRRGRVWELLAFSRSRLSAAEPLCRVTLPARPVTADTWRAEGILVLQLADRVCMFSVTETLQLVEQDDAQAGAPPPAADDDDEEEEAAEHEEQDGEGQEQRSLQPNSSKFAVRRASSASAAGAAPPAAEGPPLLLTLVESVFPVLDPDESQAPMSLCVMQCGATRRAGGAVKLPKCALLASDGQLSVLDLDEGSRLPIAEGVFQLFPQSWSKIDQADDIVLQSFLEQSLRARESKAAHGSPAEVGKLPSALLYTIWVMDRHGMRLWLPALDMSGESLNTRCADAHEDVVPIGVLESHGLVVGVTQRARAVGRSRTPCFEASIRVTPTTHGLLSWLVRAGRSDLASQVLVQASMHLPLFKEALDLFLFGAVETDYQRRGKKGFQPLLPLAIRLLRTGKAVAVIDPRTYDALVVTCARKMEFSRWELFFASAGNPEQLFNDAIYSGDLDVAAASMIIADHFSPHESSRRLASLAHAAALKKDDKLLEQIETFQTTKLG